MKVLFIVTAFFVSIIVCVPAQAQKPDNSAGSAHQMCITPVMAASDGNLPTCLMVATVPISVPPLPPGVSVPKQVCVLSVINFQDGTAHGFLPCQIIAALPFTFSEQDYSDYAGMVMADSNGINFITDESQELMVSVKTSLGKTNVTGIKSLIEGAVEAFRRQRNSFCGRHPSMSVYDLDYVGDGPEFTETPPQPCSAASQPLRPQPEPPSNVSVTCTSEVAKAACDEATKDANDLVFPPWKISIEITDKDDFSKATSSIGREDGRDISQECQIPNDPNKIDRSCVAKSFNIENKQKMFAGFLDFTDIVRDSPTR